MYKEDLNGKLIQRAELVAQQQDFEQMYDFCVENNSEEYDFVINEQDLMIKQYNHKSQIEKFHIELKGKQKEKERIYNDILREDENLDMRRQENKIIRENLRNNKGIQKLEMIREEICKNMDKLASETLEMPSVMRICESFLQNCDINMESLFKQNESGLSNLNFLTETVCLIFLRHEAQESDLETNLEGFWRYIQMNFSKQKIIISSPSENHKYKEFLFNLILNEMELVKERQQFSEDYEVSLNELKEKERQLEQLQTEIENIDQSIIILEKDKTKESEELKLVENQILCLFKNLDLTIKQKSQSAFYQYLNSQRETFEHIKKVYGQEELNKIEQENFQKLYDIVKAKEQELINRIKQLNVKIVYYDDIIHLNVRQVDEQLLPNLKNTINQISQLKEQLDSLAIQENNSQDKQAHVQENVSEFKRQLDQRLAEAEQVKAKPTQQTLLSLIFLFTKPKKLGIEINQVQNKLKVLHSARKTIDQDIKELEINFITQERKIITQANLESDLKFEINKQNTQMMDFKFNPFDLNDELQKREYEIQELQIGLLQLNNIKKSVEDTIQITPNLIQTMMVKNASLKNLGNASKYDFHASMPQSTKNYKDLATPENQNHTSFFSQVVFPTTGIDKRNLISSPKGSDLMRNKSHLKERNACHTNNPSVAQFTCPHSLNNSSLLNNSSSMLNQTSQYVKSRNPSNQVTLALSNLKTNNTNQNFGMMKQNSMITEQIDNDLARQIIWK